MSAGSDKPLVFVLMPFDSEFEQIYTELIIPALDAAGYRVERADDIVNQQNIMMDIVRSIWEAELIVAELTTLNPNVLYELGIAHGLRKPTIVLSQSLDRLPFDLRSYRVVSYSTHFAEINKLTAQLRHVAADHLQGAVSFGNPVTDFLGSISDTTLPISPKATERSLPRLAKDAEEPGYLDISVKIQTASEVIVNVMTEIGGSSIALSQTMALRASEFSALESEGSAGGASKAREIATSLAEAMVEYSEKIDHFLPEFTTAWGDFADGLERFVLLPQFAKADVKKTNLLRRQADTLLENVRASLDAARQARGSLGALRGISQDLNYAVRRTESTFDEIINAYAAAEAYLVRMHALLRRRREPPGPSTGRRRPKRR